MNAVFSKVVSTSICANWLILAVILLRIVLRKAPRATICLLWALVAVRLICPFSIESPVSFLAYTPSSFQERLDPNLIHVDSPVPDLPAAEAGEAADIPTAPEEGRTQTALPWIWCAGTLLMLAYFACSYFRMKRLVREAVRESEDIWICDSVETPFILGIVKPRIYLPSGTAEPDRGYVIAHERSHLRCKDHWWKPLSFVLLSVFWFDPFVWAAYFLVCRDIEFACDERVIHGFSMADKKAYSKALLACSGSRRVILACPVAFGENAVVKRIRNVLHYRKPGFWMILISGFVLIITAAGFLTVPAGAENAMAANQEVIASVGIGAIRGEEAGPSDRLEKVLPSDGAVEMDAPNGILTEANAKENFKYNVMLVRDPSRIHLAASAEHYSTDTPGKVITEVMEQEKADAAFSAGPYFDDGSASPTVGSVPCGLVISNGNVLWDNQEEITPENGFVGWNQENILIVSTSMTREEAQEQGIRDGCTAGPVLMINGKPNEEVSNSNSGYRPRIAIGQQANGTVVIVCADGRNPESLGATWADMIDILIAYGAVNACGLNDGSSAELYLRDAGQPQMLNQTGRTGQRRMPAFWIVKAAE